ncbi:glycoside hydrolase family 99-like domain-containing protein [Novosphingobium lentum]|uniref:glycoside hydrolase family 99-like domain-containing protein n=1 Tax=Novosphingobium lentum TaxID=145287 RepID=UPI0008315D88|nr:glycoside hydrolase family 99-like domain-containing protein [Novosphingobium lentum]
MRLLYDQYKYNISKSPEFVDESALPTDHPAKVDVRFIAYYLPQFHAIKENDAWWGAGFTEWTNVSKALPRYVGHEQPRMPADLGFYDLGNVDVLRRQAELAKRGGVHGFCIHHYWFSGRRILETPLELLLAHPDIDLPFCLNWANENWTRRWDGAEHDILLEQRYAPGDDVAFAESLLPALRDPRYIRIGGRPLIMVYRPSIVPEMLDVGANWRTHLIAAGVGDPYLVMSQAFGDQDPRPYGLDASAGFPPHNGGLGLPNEIHTLQLIDKQFDGKAVSFDKMVRATLANESSAYRSFPGVCPRWDNEPRKPGRSVSVFGTSAAGYGQWLRVAAERAMKAPIADERIVFINAWNEWAEGAYLEPDLHHGYAYLAETRRVLDGIAGNVRAAPAVHKGSRLAAARPSKLNLLSSLARRVRAKIARKLLRR